MAHALAVLIGAVSAEAATLRVCASGCAYSDLQPALDAAQPGDIILLRAGETFVGNYMLRARSTSSTAFIVVRSDASDAVLPPAGARLVPEGRQGANTSRSSLARIIGKGGTMKSQPVLRAEPGAHHYRFQFIQFDGSAQLGYETLIAFGTDDPQSNPPHDIVLDRVYIHGHPTKGQKRGVALNGRAIDVVNSYIADIKAVNADSQALGGWNGQGPFRIVNNYIEGAGENIMFGGAWPATTGLIPGDIEIRRNHITKPTAWQKPILSPPPAPKASASGGGALAAGTHYFKVVAILRTGTRVAVSLPSPEASAAVSSGGRVTLSWGSTPTAEAYRIFRGTSSGGQSVYTETSSASTSFVYTGSGEVSGKPPTSGTRWVAKNLLELKNAQRVTIDGNLMEHNWAGDQPGYAIVLTPRNYNGVAPWSAVRDVTLTNNVLRHSAGAINILGYDDTEATGSALTERITIRNNLFDDIDPANWGGGLTKVFLIGQGASQVVFDRNTIIHGTTTVLAAYGKPMQKFVFTNNIALHGKYGVFGSGSSTGNPTLAEYFPGAVFAYNVLAGGKASLYPPNNAFPSLTEWHASFVDAADHDFRILSSSPFYGSGSGGTVPGADLAALAAAQGGGPPPSPPPSSPPSNGAPTADAGGPYASTPGQAVTVDGSGSSDPENGITHYVWSWGDEVVIHAADVSSQGIHGNWQKAAVTGAAGGVALVNPNKGMARIATPAASPSSFVDITFRAAAGVPYYVWFRMQAEGNSYSNDSVYVQFSGAVDGSGRPLARIGSTNALSMILEQGRHAGVSGWGWTDSVYDGDGSPVYFATAGQQTLRLQPREDGVRIDQIVISSVAYAGRMPGLPKADTKVVSRALGTGAGVHATHAFAHAGVYPVTLTVTDDQGASAGDSTTATVSASGEGPLAAAGGPYQGTAGSSVFFDGRQSTGSIASARWRRFDDIVLSGAALASAVRRGSWTLVSDPTAAAGTALQDPNTGAAKVSPALASPPNYVDVTFVAAANVPYRLWLRMRAASDSYHNDSLHVQFSNAVSTTGSPAFRIGTTSSLDVVLEEGSHSGVSGWGWNDASYGGLAPPITFASAGVQTIRIQRREDGVAIDQIVLSADRYFDERPGLTRGDRTIVTAELGTAAGLTATHQYRWPGVYPLLLTITDSSGRSSTDTTTVTIR